MNRSFFIERSFLLLAFVTGTVLAFAQAGRPFCVWEDNGLYQFSRHDAASGTLTPIAPIAGMDFFVLGSKHTYSADQDIYYVVGQDGATPRLYNIDASTGTVLFSPAVSDNVVGISTWCMGDSLYGLREDNNNYDLVKIEPGTCFITSIAPVTNMSAYVAESFALDQKRGLYTFVALSGGQFYLRSYDLNSGSLIHDHLFPDNLVAYQYNCLDSSIYALWEVGPNYSFEKVDHINGTHTSVAILGGVTPGYVIASSSIEQSGVYTYRGFDINNGLALVSVNVASGNVIYNTPTSDNAVGFAEGMCCSDQTVSVNELEFGASISVFPVPSSGLVQISSSASLSALRLYSIDGELLHTISTENNALNIQMDLTPFAVGTYLLQATTIDGSIVQKKLIRSSK